MDLVKFIETVLTERVLTSQTLIFFPNDWDHEVHRNKQEKQYFQYKQWIQVRNSEQNYPGENHCFVKPFVCFTRVIFIKIQAPKGEGKINFQEVT